MDLLGKTIFASEAFLPMPFWQEGLLQNCVPFVDVTHAPLPKTAEHSAFGGTSKASYGADVSMGPRRHD